jgi:CheY-like chemotaxis protein
MNTKRVLIVDDAPEFAHLVEAALSTMSIPLEMTIYLSGEEAWLEALKTRFDLVITDLRLPGISGTELVRRLRSRYPEIKIIAVSGLAEAGLNERTRAAGVDAFYRKPVEIPLLLTQIDNLLSESGQENYSEIAPIHQIRPSQQDTTPITYSQEKTFTPSPVEIATMQELERCLLKLMQESGAEGVALTNDTGFVLVGLGTAIKYKPDTSLVEAFSLLTTTAKKSEYQQTETNTTGLMSLPGVDNDLIVTSLGKFLFWLLFPTTSISVESGKAVAAWNEAKSNLQYLVNLVTPLPMPRGPHPPRQTLSVKNTIVPPVKEEPKKGKVSTGDLSNKPIPKEEVDAFWSSGNSEKNDVGISSDAISFDQASNLGLLPKNET